MKLLNFAAVLAAAALIALARVLARQAAAEISRMGMASQPIDQE